MENKVLLMTIKQLKKYVEKKDEMIEYFMCNSSNDNKMIIKLYDERTKAEILILQLRNQIIKNKLKK